MSLGTFGPFELVDRLGTGGMAETFLALRRGPGGFEQEVCVKRILPTLQTDPDFVGQFMDEARLAAQLRHGNITQVVDFGVVAGAPYLAFELIDGMDLRRLLHRLRDDGRSLDAELTALIATEIARALDFAHRPERRRPAVIHRDVSPSNVLLSRAGEVYLSDFGIARALGDKGRTASGVVKGKVPYMAPEYALAGTLDARSDLYALGVVLFEALAGRRPYQGRTDLETLQHARDGHHAPLAKLAPDAPVALRDVVERLIRPEPADRLGDAAALLEALVPVAPRPTASRRLGSMVQALAERVTARRPISPTGPTVLAGGPPAGASSSFPEVRVASPSAATLTREPSVERTEPLPPPDDGDAPTTARALGQAAHARPGPEQRGASAPGRRAVLAWTLLAAALAFGAAAAAAYVIVTLVLAPLF
ncbi:MAG: protein kinase [Sandaracinaceae bacterium]